MRTLLVQADKLFRINIPDDAKITFGPWSPSRNKGEIDYGDRYGKATGTLRIYQGTKDNIIGCFSGVTSFRDMSMDYQEKIAVEEGDSIWKSDNDGYKRESRVQRREEWAAPERQLNPAPTRRASKRRKESEDF